ncbi:hypothetical protein pdam_00020190 [Pocillopora damicornis]|uniref:Uncharacterized protein n=2 Tax=Pocillopora damicornis TaxID=46731 RepID=A0A3M6V684_POCDA|nr:hypothetical protein pdam_00020190 [Pocillopora damicornis]
MYPKKVLRRILKEKRFMIMENAMAEADESGLKIPLLRKTRSASPIMQGASPCQWQWRSTDRPSEIPRFLREAHCPNCDHYCTAIKYTVKVLVQDKCDPKSGLPIWRWKEREIKVGYFYKGSR